MARFVFLDATGKTIYTVTAENADAYIDGDYYDGLLCKNAPSYITNEDDLLNSYYSGGTFYVAGDLSSVATWNRTNIPANGTTTATISTLPNPSTITITVPDSATPIVQDVVETSGSFSLTTTATGFCDVRIVTTAYKTTTYTLWFTPSNTSGMDFNLFDFTGHIMTTRDKMPYTSYTLTGYDI